MRETVSFLKLKKQNIIKSTCDQIMHYKENK